VPFLLSATLIGIGYWVRVAVAETPIFEAARQSERPPVIEVLQCHAGQLAVGMGLRIAENVSYYLFTVFSITYITEVVGLSRSVALNAVLAACVAHAVALPGFAALSDTLGRRPVYLFGAIGVAFWGFAFFNLLDSAAAPAIVAAFVAGLVLHAAMYGPQAAFIAELFPTRVRYSGASIAYQVTSIFAGSLAPIIALALLQRSGSAQPIALYLMLTCLITALAALFARETKRRTFEEIDAV
jgi:MFS family permease